jgi:hypothetical protein
VALNRYMSRMSFVRVGAVTIFGTALAAYQTWVDFSPLGVDIRWNGLGFVGGDQAHTAADVGASINPLGWVVAVAMVIAGVLFIASTYTQPALLLIASIGFAAVAFLTVVACLISPGLLLGDLLKTLGVSALDPDQVVKTSWLWIEVLLIAMFIVTAVMKEFLRRKLPQS